jgi:hypothetical protein
MTENEMLYKVKTADGREVGIYKDKTHYRAYDADKKLVGDPRVSLAQLLTDLGAPLEGDQSPKPEEPAAKKREEKKLGEAETANKKKLVITYDGSHFRAYDADKKLVGEPYVLLNSLLPAVKAVDYTAMDPAVKRETPPEQQEAPIGEVKNHIDTDNSETKDAPPEPEPANPTVALVADVTKCGQHEAGNCKMDNVSCDSACGEHASRAAKAAPPPAETPKQREEREFNEALAAENKNKAAKVPSKRK